MVGKKRASLTARARFWRQFMKPCARAAVIQSYFRARGRARRRSPAAGARARPALSAARSSTHPMGASGGERRAR
eukprot:5682901-Pyramimonas_sp.AAC.1